MRDGDVVVVFVKDPERCSRLTRGTRTETRRAEPGRATVVQRAVYVPPSKSTVSAVDAERRVGTRALSLPLNPAAQHLFD